MAKKHKVESKYKKPDVLIEKLKKQLEDLKYPDFYWEESPMLKMDGIKAGTLSKAKLNGAVYVKGYVFEKTESLKKAGESITIQCTGFSFKDKN